MRFDRREVDEGLRFDHGELVREGMESTADQAGGNGVDRQEAERAEADAAVIGEVKHQTGGGAVVDQFAVDLAEDVRRQKLNLGFGLETDFVASPGLRSASVHDGVIEQQAACGQVRFRAEHFRQDRVVSVPLKDMAAGKNAHGDGVAGIADATPSEQRQPLRVERSAVEAVTQLVRPRPLQRIVE